MGLAYGPDVTWEARRRKTDLPRGNKTQMRSEKRKGFGVTGTRHRELIGILKPLPIHHIKMHLLNKESNIITLFLNCVNSSSFQFYLLKTN